MKKNFKTCQGYLENGPKLLPINFTETKLQPLDTSFKKIWGWSRTIKMKETWYYNNIRKKERTQSPYDDDLIMGRKLNLHFAKIESNKR